MAKVIKIDVSQWADHLEKLGQRFRPAMLRGMNAGAMRCIPILHNATAQAPPASPNGTIGAFDTGLYKAAWRSASINNGAKVFNMRSYSGVIEHGRRPYPVSKAGIRNLEGWAKRKLKLSGKEAKSAAWAIAKTLAKRPLKARRVMIGSEEKMIEAVEKEVLHELDLELGR